MKKHMYCLSSDRCVLIEGKTRYFTILRFQNECKEKEVSGERGRERRERESC